MRHKSGCMCGICIRVLARINDDTLSSLFPYPQLQGLPLISFFPLPPLSAVSLRPVRSCISATGFRRRLSRAQTRGGTAFMVTALAMQGPWRG